MLPPLLKPLSPNTFTKFMFLFILTGSIPEILSQSHDYGTSCSNDHECDSTQHFFCNKRTQSCDCSMGSKWNSGKKICLQPEGQDCNSHHGPNCTTNAACIAGKCRCNADHLTNGFGACQGSYNLPCDQANPCSTRYWLQCPDPKFDPITGDMVESRCQCFRGNTSFVWDENKQKCVGLVGSRCDNPDAIGRNDDSSMECIESASCVNEMCECSPGYTVTKERTCLLKYGEKCNNRLGEYCNKYDFLNCIDGKCNCEFYMQMKYDEELGKCQLLVGEPCGWPINGSTHKGSSAITRIGNGLDDRVHRCVQGAVCISRNQHGRGICACVDGQSITAENTCEVGEFAEVPCTNRENNYANEMSGGGGVGGNSKCQVTQLLACRYENDSTVCSCGDGMFFDGTDCIVFPEESCITNNKCAPNSSCKDEKCVCDENFELNYTHSTCDPVENIQPESYLKSTGTPGSNTATTTATLETAGFKRELQKWELWESLNLRNKCEFEKSISGLVVWNEDRQSCLGLVGARCDKSSDCIEHSYCEQTSGLCKCFKDDVVHENKTCKVVEISDNSVGVDVAMRRTNQGRSGYVRGNKMFYLVLFALFFY